MKNLFITLIILFVGQLALAGEQASPAKCAVLLHGLGRNAGSMNKVAKALEERGYLVWNKTYPSRQKSIQELAGVVGQGLLFCKGQRSQNIYFVTHSLGGILVRQYFQGKSDRQVKAVVMLAPPNKGSELSDHFRDQKWYQVYSGIAGQQLGTSPKSLPNSLKRISLPVGIIAGTETSDPWFAHLFKGPNDGKVLVENTKLVEMKDFIEVPAGHTFIMRNPEVINQILYFFETQKFWK